MAKRGHGEGCISKRKNGTWVSIVTVGTDDQGRQKRRFIYGKSRQEVSEKLKKVLGDMQSGTYVEPSKLTLGEWLDFWFKEYMFYSIKLSTRVSYNTFIKKHIKPELGKTALNNLNTDLLQLFFNQKYKNGRIDKKGGLSPKTLRNMYNMFHEALEKAHENSKIHKNPIKGVKLPKMIQKEMRVLTVNEQEKLTLKASDEKLGVGVILTLFTGLRLGCFWQV